MEQFFGILQRGLGQLDATGEYEEGTLRELKESYQKFDAAMQQNMLRCNRTVIGKVSDNIADLHLVIPAGSSSG